MAFGRKLSKFLESLGLTVTSTQNSHTMNEYRENLERLLRKLEFYMQIQSDSEFNKAFDACKHSQSQLGADIFALSYLNFKENGFFIECGAGDGINLSNTFLLEKNYGWKGILVEPNIKFHTDILATRDSVLEKRLLSGESGNYIEFSVLEVGELSGITNSLGAGATNEIERYQVESLSLRDLLLLHRAPPVIDYFSLDVEGHEYEILKSFDFLAYKFRVISVEHNFSASRNLIYDLLTSNGYSRIHENLSSFDDFYIYPSTLL